MDIFEGFDTDKNLLSDEDLSDTIDACLLELQERTTRKEFKFFCQDLEKRLRKGGW